jgi:hypothetical protein
MRFREWITEELLNEQAWFSFPQPVAIGVELSDSPRGPFHVEYFNVDGIDMRFEDWRLEPGSNQPPPLHFSAPIVLRNGKHAFINYTNAFVPQKAVVEEEPSYVQIRPDWARFAVFYRGNVVTKSSQFEDERDEVRNSYTFRNRPLSIPLASTAPAPTSEPGVFVPGV